MSSSVVTTRGQSSATGFQTEDCPSTSPPHIGISILLGARVSTTPEPQEANTELDNTYPPHPIDCQPSVNGRRNTRFTLYRLLSAAIPTVFVASKFIDSFHGRALTLDLLDLVPAVLVLVLNVFSWFESDPPPYLGWLFDTDLDYLLDITKRGAGFILLLTKDLPQRAKKNPSVSLGIVFGAFSAFLAIFSVLLLSRNHHPGAYVSFFSSDCLGLAFISLTLKFTVVGGDRHQSKAYKHAFFMSAFLTRVALLASWILRFWFPDQSRISTILDYSGFSSLYITYALGWFTGHLEKLMQTKTFILARSVYTLVCISISSGSILQRLLNNPNFHRDLTITIGIWAYNVFEHGLCMYLWW